MYILSAREYSVRVGAVLRKKDSPDASFSVESGPIPFRVDVVSDNAHRDSAQRLQHGNR
jgi:hypothetical protein